MTAATTEITERLQVDTLRSRRLEVLDRLIADLVRRGERGELRKVRAIRERVARA